MIGFANIDTISEDIREKVMEYLQKKLKPGDYVRNLHICAVFDIVNEWDNIHIW